MKGIIVYKGKYGATAQYAQWLGEELSIPVAAAVNLNGADLKPYDFIVIGTSVYIGRLQISKWLNLNLDAIRGKKIYFYLVAGTQPQQKEKLENYLVAGVPEEIRRRAAFYFFHGKMILSELSWTDRFMLKMGARLTKDPIEKKDMLTEFNDVKKENMAGLVSDIQKFYAPANEPI